MSHLPALGWKPLFYDAVLPALRRLGPERCDLALSALGRAVDAIPLRGRGLSASLDRARRCLDADWDIPSARAALTANIPRFVARDYPLDTPDDADALSRFEVVGSEHLDGALSAGRGVIVLGCHLGAYIAGVHWLLRRGTPTRLLVQRPKHVSNFLQSHFDRSDAPHPQHGFFLRRRLPAGEGAEILVRARAALRDGLALYMSGDIPWPACHARPGSLLGQVRPFQSVWADLSSITGAPVLPLFALHLPGGRYLLSFAPPWHPHPSRAVPEYLRRLELQISTHPHEAIAHLTWPCYHDAPAPLPSPARPVRLNA